MTGHQQAQIVRSVALVSHAVHAPLLSRTVTKSRPPPYTHSRPARRRQLTTLPRSRERCSSLGTSVVLITDRFSGSDRAVIGPLCVRVRAITSELKDLQSGCDLPVYRATVSRSSSKNQVICQSSQKKVKTNNSATTTMSARSQKAELNEKLL